MYFYVQFTCQMRRLQMSVYIRVHYCNSQKSHNELFRPVSLAVPSLTQKSRDGEKALFPDDWQKSMNNLEHKPKLHGTTTWIIWAGGKRNHHPCCNLIKTHECQLQCVRGDVAMNSLNKVMYGTGRPDQLKQKQTKNKCHWWFAYLNVYLDQLLRLKHTWL